MNRSDLREAIQTKTGYPERGTTGQDRLNLVLNYALRQLRRDAPESLFRETYRFRTEVPVSTGKIDVHTGDALVFVRQPSSVTSIITASEPATTWRARWLEIERDGKYYTRRIRDVFRLVYDASLCDQIVVDEPWDNVTDTDLTYRIYTHEYPYPADIEKIRSVVRNPETNPRELMEAVFPEELQRSRLGSGWRSQGTPERYARGDYYQLESPHYTPKATVVSPEQGLKDWGYDASANEHGNPALGGQTAPQYGPAGTFSYLVCHVWGRWRFLNPSQEGVLPPFYISSASQATEKVTTTWGGGAIQVATPDVDVVYGFGNDSTLPSYHRHGTEKWIFRARHSTESEGAGSNHALTKRVEADNIYYLWRITEGYTQITLDRGDEHPPDRQWALKDFHGHYHLRLDRAPASVDEMMARIVRKPYTLKHDNDVPNIPAECFEALISLSCAYLVGDRDGNPKRKSLYYADYERELDRLKRVYTFGGFEQSPFGDGLGSGPTSGYADYPITES